MYLNLFNHSPADGHSGHFSVFFCNNSVNIVTWAFPQDTESVHKWHFKWIPNIPVDGYTSIYSTILLLSTI